ncbi:MAG: bifunctional riboflavin kinase/FAD synthetase [Candidatus Brocadiales bacterium]
MDTISGIGKLPGELRWPILTIGFFDGVHLGHQKVIGRTIRWAKEKGGKSIVVTFDRHPKSFLKKRPQSFITSLEHRLVLLERLGIDLTVILEFNHKIAEMSTEEFVRQIISGWLGTKGMVLGFDCSFGKDRGGDVHLIQKLGEKYGFDVRSCLPVKIEDEIVSSTSIRQQILSGDLIKAEKMLGRHVSVLGTVVRCIGRGRNLGYPTANLDLHHEVKPPNGVYATKVKLHNNEYYALTNIGYRPTFEGQSASGESTGFNGSYIEVYILDFNKDIYGKVLEVQFLSKLRDEKKFESAEALKAQIKNDTMELSQIIDKKTLTN